MLKSLNVLDAAASQAHFADHSGTLVNRVTKALTIFDALVEGDRRPPEDRIASIEVNPDEVDPLSGNIKSFRADADRNNDKVRISVQDDTPVVVHELGHQVEFHLSNADWLDIHQILRARTKSQNLVDIYGTGKESALDVDMPGFAAKYPNTHVYGGKVYSSGDTEVVSMTLEMFSDPVHAKAMIRNDPVLAATVLRAIRPKDFGNRLSLPLQDLLPRGRTALGN